MSEYFAAGGAVLLAILGAVVAIDAFSGKKRWIWMGAFCCIGVLTLIFTFSSINENANKRRELISRIDDLAGVNNFCFFQAIIKNPHDFTSPVQLMVTNNSNGPIKELLYFISPYWVKGDAKNPSYASIMHRAEKITCPRGSYPTSIAIKPGRYRIEFTNLDAAKDSPVWHEVLTIEQSYKMLVTTADVFLSNGKTIRSRRPSGYHDW